MQHCARSFWTTVVSLIRTDGARPCLDYRKSGLDKKSNKYMKCIFLIGKHIQIPVWVSLHITNCQGQTTPPLIEIILQTANFRYKVKHTVTSMQGLFGLSVRIIRDRISKAVLTKGSSLFFLFFVFFMGKNPWKRLSLP